MTDLYRGILDYEPWHLLVADRSDMYQVCMYASSGECAGLLNFAGKSELPFVELPLGFDPLGGMD